jgi:hypothetical protein
MLHMCHDTWELALKKYGTIDLEMEEKGWGITKYQTFRQLRSLLKRYGVKPACREIDAQIVAYIKDQSDEGEKFLNFASTVNDADLSYLLAGLIHRLIPSWSDLFNSTPETGTVPRRCHLSKTVR